MRGTAGVILLLLFSVPSLAQESVTQETNAPSVRWYQLNTPNFRILYPKGFDEQAQRVANGLETVREPEGRTMGTVPKKISIILQNQSSLSNGFVTLAPRRSEFYTMPSQNYNFVGTNDWLNILTAHEYRHMVQFQRSITGFNKVFNVLFGQQAVAAMGFAAAPQWFWEGDAVVTETAFTNSGRGRIPNFDLVFRTNLSEGRVFNYHKQYLRSYKHNIPNHYVLGYNMVSYLRQKTGDPMIWEKVTGRSWATPFIPFAFSNALKKETGMHVTDLYREMAAARQKEYEAMTKDLVFTSFDRHTSRKSVAYTDYSFPQPLDNGNVVVTKSGIGDIEQLVVLAPDGRELRRYVQGIINDAGMLSAAGQRVVWNEYRYDPRWLIRNYSVVKGYDFRTGQTRVLSRHARYAGAALSPDGTKVATIRSDNDYTLRMVILDYATGNVLAEMPNETNDQLSMPRWSEDGQYVVALRINNKGKTVTRFRISDGTHQDLLPWSQENIGYPVPYKNYLMFSSPVSGIDNIYAYDLSKGTRYQVTSSRYGAYNPAVSPDGQRIYYNEQTRDGLDVVSVPFDFTAWKTGEFVPTAPQPFQQMAEQEGQISIFDKLKNEKYPVTRYHRAAGMINPHSWGPYLTNSLTRINLGVASNDILSTTSLNLGYTYDINERTGSWNAGLSYQGFFPILDANVSMANRSANEGELTYYEKVNGKNVKKTGNLTFTWEEKSVVSGIRIPLLTTSSKYVGNVTFSDYIGATHISNFKNSLVPSGGRLITPDSAMYFYRDYQGNGNLVYNQFGISAYRLMKQSRRDIYSKWGQTIFLNYYNTPYGGDYSGEQFSFYTQMYFPGLFKHHSIWGWWAYQKSAIPTVNLSTGEGLDNYVFRNQIPLVRGQSVIRTQDMYTMSANYTLPLWYPDIAMGPVLNLQRLRGNAFVDYGYGRSVYKSTYSMIYTSFGGELKMDINVMRFLPQFSVGVRYSYGYTEQRVNGATNYRVGSGMFEVLLGSFNF
ncbi:MAG: PD40 domain-containing protein [Bacteroidetes bacterium]|nr:PD40 domain-containing protein [Bacteroidota bacterium]